MILALLAPILLASEPRMPRTEGILVTAALLGIIGGGAIMYACCRGLLPLCGGAIPFTGWLRCRVCAQPIRGCNHIGGVPSTWQHKKTGLVYGPDGHQAEHP